jgi:prepilin-type N-terminal cleavage/methylation domain-containing protein
MRINLGFTLVEIAIVMIVIGLLIGGIFTGLRLIENAQVNKTIRDLKAIESATLTFRDTFGRLPGDIRDPSNRLPNCNTPPCSISGDGNRQIGAFIVTAPITNMDENFTFWHHLQAASLLQMDYSNTSVMEFGDGTPSSSIGGGYRLNNYSGPAGFCPERFVGTQLNIVGHPSADWNAAGSNTVPCNLIRQIDEKMDNGMAASGNMIGGWGCETTASCNSEWSTTQGILFYDTPAF